MSRITSPIKNILKRYWERQAQLHPLRRTNRYHKMYYGRPIDLDNPRSLHEKIAVMQFTTDLSLWRRLTDKVAVREYIAEKGYADLLNEVYYIWDKLPEFDDFAAKLPKTCVVKTSHTGGSEGVFIIRDKDTADLRAIYSGLSKSLADDYGRRTSQLQYIGIPPRVIVEKLLYNDNDPEAPLDDYKFFCINGEPDTINAITERDVAAHSCVVEYYNTAMERYDWGPQNGKKLIPAPQNLERMLKVARDLSAGLPFVRVDLYESNGKIVFGEMTLTPGFTYFIATYGDKVLRWGERTDISGIRRIQEIPKSYF